MFQGFAEDNQPNIECDPKTTESGRSDVLLW